MGKKIVVGQAHEPHRMMVNHPEHAQEEFDEGQDMNTQGWEHHMEFWAFAEPMAGLIRVCVGQAQEPHRCMLNHTHRSQMEWNNRENTMDYQGWEHLHEFWVAPPTCQ